MIFLYVDKGSSPIENRVKKKSLFSDDNPYKSRISSENWAFSNLLILFSTSFQPGFFCLFFLTSTVFASSHSFQEFLDQVRKTATEQGVSKSTIDKAFFELTPKPSAITSDKAQAEFNENFWHYVNKRVSNVRKEEDS